MLAAAAPGIGDAGGRGRRARRRPHRALGPGARHGLGDRARAAPARRRHLCRTSSRPCSSAGTSPRSWSRRRTPRPATVPRRCPPTTPCCWSPSTRRPSPACSPDATRCSPRRRGRSGATSSRGCCSTAPATPTRPRSGRSTSGYDTDVAHRVVLVSPDDDAAHGAGPGQPARRGRGAPPARRALALTVVRDTETVAVVPEDADPAAVGAACARRLARGRVPDPDAVWPVTVVLGGPVRSPADLATSYDQARRTLAVARRLGRAGRVLRFDDLGVHRLLLQIPDPESARDFAREVLGRLATDRSARDGGAAAHPRALLPRGRQPAARRPGAVGAPQHGGLPPAARRGAQRARPGPYRDRLAAQVALEILGEMEE